ncbi:MAG: DUF4189 domain-containing protein [Lysobacter sp.]|nr:DUF4189 domain-containing protein [Lysobacter sp.]
MTSGSRRWILPLALFAGLMVNGARAEQGCPSGFTPNAAGTPGAQCIPIGGLNGSGDGGGYSQDPGPQWASRWGAIAIDNASGKTGLAGSMSSKRKAEKGALAQCKEKGGANCQVKLAYRNQCGVVAWGEGNMTTAHAPTVADASKLAVGECERSVSKCEVFFSDCSYAERVQ